MSANVTACHPIKESGSGDQWGRTNNSCENPDLKLLACESVDCWSLVRVLTATETLVSVYGIKYDISILGFVGIFEIFLFEIWALLVRVKDIHETNAGKAWSQLHHCHCQLSPKPSEVCERFFVYMQIPRSLLPTTWWPTNSPKSMAIACKHRVTGIRSKISACSINAVERAFITRLAEGWGWGWWLRHGDGADDASCWFVASACRYTSWGPSKEWEQAATPEKP